MNNLKKRCLTLLLSIAMIVTYMPMSMITAYAEGHLDPGGKPVRHKSIEDNEDGTYKLTLDVTGDSTTNSENHKANVVIILDTSGSMNFEVPTAEKSPTGRYGYIGNSYDGYYVQLRDEYGNALDNGSTYTGTLLYYDDGWQVYPDSEPRFTSDSGESTRLAQTKPAVNSLIDTLLNQNQKTSDMIEISFMTFAGSATYRTPQSATGNWVSGLPTATAGTRLKSQVSNITANGGTNWDDALHDAKTLADNKNDGDKTYIVFFTDGEPTYNNGGVSGGRHYHGNAQQGGGNHTTPADINSAVYEATQLNNADDYELFGIFAYGQEKFFDDDKEGYMKQVVEAADGAGALANHGFYANDQKSIDEAFKAIASAVASAVGLEQVTITDGTTNQVTTQSGEISELLEVDTASYEYWMTWTVANNGTFDLFQNGETTTYTATVNGDNIVITWKDGDENKTATYQGTKDGNVVKIKWDKATDFYNIAPPDAQFENGSVNWDLKTAGTLLDGVTYSYSFDVYPSQETYDTIAKLKNGELQYNDLDPAVQQYIGADYSLKTNTNATLSYDDARDQAGVQTVPFDNPDPVGIESSKMKVQKHWDNVLDPANVKEEPVTMTIAGDGEDFGAVELNQDNGWAGELNIATGILKVNKETGEVRVLDSGHDFEFSESTGEGQHHWQLEAAVVHPMIINGTVTTLEKVDSAPAGMGNSDYYKDGSTEYYRIKAGTKDYGVYKATSTAEVTTLSATNHRRGYLNLTKAVNGEDAPADAKFDYTIKINDPNGDDVWFSVFYDGHYLDASEYLDAASLSKVTAEETDGEKTGFYYVDNNTELKFQLKKGWSLRFLNLPTGTKYSIVEGNSDTENENFDLESIDLKVRTKEGGQWVDIDDPQSDNVNTKTASGTMNYPNAAYDYVFTNKYGKEDIEITKIWDDTDDQDGVRPSANDFKAFLKLKADGTDVTSANASKLTVTDNDDGTYTAKWTGLNRYSGNNLITYTVEESTVTDYNAPVYKDKDGNTLDGHTVDHGSITNSRDADTTSVTVVKEWDDDSDRDGVRPASIDVKLIDADGKEYGTATLGPDQEGTTVSGNNWSYTWTGLPKNSNKSYIRYTVAETLPASAADDYTPVAPAAVRNADGTWTVNVKNTHDIATRSYTVTKVWNDADDKDDKRPDSLDVYLYADGNRIDSSKQTFDTTENSVSYTWENLPVNKDGGTPIVYSADEDATEATAAGYEKSLVPETPSASDTNTVITNTRGTDKTTYTVVKTWDDNNNQDGVRPTEVTAQLYVGKGTDKVAYGDPVTLDAEHNWTYTWEGLEKNVPVNAVVNVNNSASTEEPEQEEEADNTVENADAAEENAAPAEEPADTAEEASEAETNEAVTEEVEEVKAEAEPEVETKTEEKAEVKAESKAEVKAEAKAEAVRATETAAVYTADETEVPEDYEKISVDSESTPGTTVITNKHDPATTSVTVKKVWDDKDNQDGKRPATVTVTLSNGVEGEERVVSLNAEGNWTATIPGLPVYRNGVEIDYTWSEDEAGLPKGYTLTDTKVEGSTTTFTNSYTPEKVNIDVSKNWDDNNNQDGKRPAELVVQLLIKGSDTVIDTVRLTAENGWKATFTNKDKYKDGVEITYVLKEVMDATTATAYTAVADVEGGDGTVKEATKDETTGKLSAEFTNKHESIKDKITVTKVWDDASDQDGKRPDDVTFTVTGSDGKTYTKTFSGTGDTWTAEVEVEKYEKGGQEVTFTVDEDAVTGYTKKIDNSKLTITNSYKPEKDTLTVTKVWDDASDQDGIRPDSVNFTVTGSDNKTYPVTVTAPETGAADTWTAQVEVDKYTDGGTPVTFTVDETVPEGYTKKSVDNDTLTITNSYTPEKDTLTVTKIWDDASDQDGKRPDSVAFTVTGSDGKTYPVTVTEPETGAADTWTAQVEVDKYEQGGKEVTFTVDETVPEGYTKKSVDNDTLTITNSYTPEKKNLTVTKIWDDASDQDGKRPDSVAFTVTGSDGKTYPVTVTEPETGATDTWTAQVEVEKYEQGGKEVTFTVDETVPEGYTKKSVDNDTLTITNSYTPEKKNLTVTKVWDDASDQDGKRPDSVAFTVTGSDGKTYPVTVTEPETGAADTWTAQVEVEKYEQGGKEVTFTVDEALVEKYTKSIDNDTLTITNSYSPEVEKIEVTKIWDDASNQDGKRPESVAFTVTGSDKKTYDATLSGNGDTWTAEVEVDKYTAGGTPVTFTVDEAAVTGYTKKIDNSKLTITNSYKPETKKLTVTKIWDDASDQDGKRPESVAFTVTGSDNNTYPVTVTEPETGAADTWTAQVEVDKYYNGGQEVTFAVDETVPEGYEKKSVDNKTLTITNSYEPEKDTLTVTKVWDDASDQDGKRPDSVAFTVTGSDNKTYPVTVAGPETGAADTWTAQVEVDKYTAGGTPVTFTVDETVPEGYTKKSVDNDTLTITNSYTPEKETITATKVWVDADNQDGYRPDDVTFTVTGSDNKTYTETFTGTGNTWTQEFEVDKYYNGGQEVTFTVDEADVADYEKTIDNDKLTITNTHAPLKTKVTVVKDWVDDSDKDKQRPGSITVNLFANNEKIDSQTLTAEDKVGDNKNQWSYTWDNLDLYKEGTKIEYDVTENAVNGYSTTIVPSTVQKDKEDESTIEYKVNVTNQIDTVVPRAKYPILKINKKDQDDVALDGVKFHLEYGEEKSADYETVDGVATIDLKDIGTGEGGLGWLPADEREGEGKTAYTFKLVETKKDGYDAAGPWDVEVKLNGDAKYEVVVKDGKSYWDRFIEWVIDNVKENKNAKTEFDGENITFNVVNPAEKHKVTVTKEFNGIDPELVKDFAIKVTYTPYSKTAGVKEKTETYKLSDATKGEDGKYVWTVDDVRYGTKVSVAEVGYDIPLYAESTDLKVSGSDITVVDKTDTSASITSMPANNDTTFAFDNRYEYTPPEKIGYIGTVDHKIDGQPVQPGQTLTYEITYTNTAAKAVDATITDKIPASTTLVDGSITEGGVLNDGVITWTKRLQPGDTAKVSFKVTVNNDAEAVVENTAKIVDDFNKDGVDTNPVTSSKPVKEVFSEPEMQNEIDGQTVRAGDELTYKLSYKNVSKDSVKVAFSDTIPDNAEFVEASEGGSLDGDTVKWAAKDVAAGETIYVTFTVKVKENNGVSVDNEGTAKVGETEYKTNVTTNPVPEVPVKTVFRGTSTTNIDGEPVAAGDTLTYNITYKNTTADPVKATITDTIPEHTTLVEGSITGDGKVSGKTITWTKDVEVGGSVTVSFKVTVDDDKAVEITNQSVVNDGNNKYESNETSNSKPVKDVFVYNEPDTSIDGNTVKPGDKLTYTITYANPSEEEAIKIDIVDNIPQYTTFDSADNGGTYDKDAGTVTWSEKELAKKGEDGDSITVSFTVTVNDTVSGETLVNEAGVKVGENTYTTNKVTNPTPPKKTVFVGDEETNIDGKRVEPNDVLTYNITYTNTSGEDVTATITDKVPDFTTYVDGSADHEGVEKDGVITWNVPVKNGESVTVSFKVTVNDTVTGETLTNEAVVRHGENEYTSNEVSNPTPPKKEVFTGGSKTNIDGQDVVPGQELTYQITFTNSKDKAVEAVITDTIPEFTTYVPDSANEEGVFADGKITWKKTVEPGKSLVVSFKVTVDKNAAGEELTNTAIYQEGVNGKEIDSNTVPNPVTKELTISKDLTDFVDNGQFVQATFAFEITGKYVDENGETKDYKNTIGMDFTSESDINQQVVVRGIPSTIKDLKVKEVYAGNYKADPAEQTAKIQEDGKNYLVEFVNTKKDHEYKGGVVNNYAKENGEYKYQSPETNE